MARKSLRLSRKQLQEITKDQDAIRKLEQISIAAETYGVGDVSIWLGSEPPDGSFECDGSLVSRSLYSELYSVIGDAFGSGDGSTTFALPDFRGYHLRGYDHGAGNDPDAASRTAQATGGATGDNVGSVQGFALQGHWHDIWTGYGYAVANNSIGTDDSSPGSGTFQNAVRDPISDGTNGTPQISSETRPINVSVMYIIKYQ
jgi:hypothetical protein